MPPIGVTENMMRQALQRWHTTDSVDDAFSQLLTFQRIQRTTGSSPRRVLNELLTQALDRLAEQGPMGEEQANLLRWRFLEHESPAQIANRLNLAESTFFRYQAEAVTALTESLYQLERVAQAELQTSLLARLPPPTTHPLVGIEANLLHLEGLLAGDGNGQHPTMLSIEGMGGIGKTTLADALVRRLVQGGGVGEVAWVSAQRRVLGFDGLIRQSEQAATQVEIIFSRLWQQLLPNVPLPPSTLSDAALHRLHQFLAHVPALIVIDNLEGIDDLVNLFPYLRRLAPHQCQFILTTRESAFQEPDIATFATPELSQADAFLLFRQEARTRHLTSVALASDAQLLPIYQRVGGNPLGLHLIIGQLHIYDLDELLEALVEGSGPTIESFYSFIYRRAWDHLDETSRQALLACAVLPPQGGRLRDLLAITALTQHDLHGAVDRLTLYNLLDCRGDPLSGRYYTIHSLTRTFLHKQVARWR